MNEPWVWVVGFIRHDLETALAYQRRLEARPSTDPEVLVLREANRADIALLEAELHRVMQGRGEPAEPTPVIPPPPVVEGEADGRLWVHWSEVWVSAEGRTSDEAVEATTAALRRFARLWALGRDRVDTGPAGVSLAGFVAGASDAELRGWVVKSVMGAVGFDLPGQPPRPLIEQPKGGGWMIRWLDPPIGLAAVAPTLEGAAVAMVRQLRAFVADWDAVLRFDEHYANDGGLVRFVDGLADDALAAWLQAGARDLEPD